MEKQNNNVAFSEVFGYGFRTYEYLPPPVNTTTFVEEQELANGMYSLRSFLFPRFYMFWFQIANLLGFHYNPYLFARQIHVFVTSFLPVSTFYFTRTLYGCRGVSTISSILVAFSVHLTQLGTHTLINSFLSPFLFIAMTSFIFYIVKTEYIYFYEMNKRKNTETTETSENSCESDEKKTAEDLKKAKPELSAINKEIKPVLGCNRKSFGLGYIKYRCAFSNFVGGFVLGVIIYIRFDLCLLIVPLYLGYIWTFIRFEKKVIILVTQCVVFTLLGALLGMVIGGMEDLYSYKIFFMSPWQWLRFNVLSNKSTVLFEMQNSGDYFKDIFCMDFMTIILNVIAVIGVLVCYVSGEIRTFQEHIGKITTLGLIFVCAVLFVCYSRLAHQETRFLHNFIVLSLIITSFGIHCLMPYFRQYLGNISSSFILCGTVVLYILNCYNKTLPSGLIRWQLQKPEVISTADVNKCIDLIGQRNDVNGAFIDFGIYNTAGYSLLHKNVPLIILIHNEYHEYRRKNSNSSSSLDLRVINRFSDFISVFNVDYLTKLLNSSREYNYIVTKSKRKHEFKHIGYAQVYNSGDCIVLYKKLQSKKERSIKRSEIQMYSSENSTLLEYESNWLFTAGVYHKVIERLEAVLKFDSSRVRTYQMLIASYVSINNMTKAYEVETNCFRRHGTAKCSQPQPKVVIHNEYSRFDSLGHKN
ncbi:hypothetical protein KUTeg_010182 [Tegillarca granosa]|uniref:Mannosyltransferase n=1 Tax=Tegillarca granosa TaxID=220873 RepID=A0ABQ9F664_TEGGR|nr:hypothetical protein KUTeg_010182 [Tegillarca granosa]